MSPAFGWVWEDWHFILFDVRCKCGWFLAKAEPIMRQDWIGGGVNGVKGICKHHGEVEAESWDITDAEA